ncbi:Bifunctional levopimaradiene synthase, chloroplastic [Canna indica]|uniref:Bifunctional levopimaradiene synthase, chloroplastic n=1 Tax=Canna indica TaxID=4628 RepID=A0AAQ3Q6F4_9LILI|nr:Bifunctional levopimaradiene synthase, chloroplastic [Canna indica]
MLNEAKSMGIDLPYELPCLQNIIKFREKKISRIPVQVMHSVHTTLLYTLEALQEMVQWEKILKLQSADGSFLSSPSSTAVVYMKTGDKKCLEFLTNLVNRFGDNAPCQYPIDLFERIWVIDTIQRLGIDHHFTKETIDALDYVSWGRDNTVPDIDDTCMALRLMRLHGYPVSSDLLEYFRDNDGNFICFPGQTHHGVSDMFNLYRFSQLAFPGERILKEAEAFVQEYLRNCVENNETDDKWSLKKALGKEVAHALKNPWRRSFQRLEAREYMDHYGDYDVWIAKTVYSYVSVNNLFNFTPSPSDHGIFRMYSVNDPKYLELAKLYYNRLQNAYKKEMNAILRWWNNSGLADPSITSISPKEIYFSIVATLYEPQFSESRMAYTKCNAIENVLKDLFQNHRSAADLKLMCEAVDQWNPSLVASLPVTVQNWDAKSAVIVRLFVDIQMHKNSHNKDKMNAVSLCMKAKNCMEKEALGLLLRKMDGAFDEVVHETLKPSLVSRSCHRLLFEHARITQLFHSDDPMMQKKMVDEAMDRFFTPV